MKYTNTQTWFGVIVTAIIAAAIICLPYQSYAWFPAPTINQVQNSPLNTPEKLKLTKRILQANINQLERDFRKVYRIPSDVKVYVTVSTNPPPVLHSHDEIIPAGTTIYAWDSPTTQPMALLPAVAVITVVVVVVVVGGVIIYVVYKCAKALDRPNTNSIAGFVKPIQVDHVGGAYVRTEIGMHVVRGFDVSSGLADAVKTTKVIGEESNVDTNYNGVISFEIQSSTDLLVWNKEYTVINNLTNGRPFIVIYDSINQPIMTNSAAGIFDGENVIFSPNDLSGCLVQDKATDIQKFWRIK